MYQTAIERIQIHLNFLRYARSLEVIKGDQDEVNHLDESIQFWTDQIKFWEDMK